MADALRVAMIEPAKITEEEWSDLLEGVPAESPTAFRIDSDERADWLLRKVADAKARAERAKAWAEREVQQAEADEARLLQRFGPELEEFAKGKLATGKRRSFSLPSGTVGFRKQPARLVVTDETAALAWAKQHAPSAVVVVPATEKLSKSDLALAVKSNGIIPDGAEMTEEEDKFFIK